MVKTQCSVWCLVWLIQKHVPSLGREWSCVDICGGVCHDGDIVTVTVVFTPSDRMVLQIFNTST